MCTSLATNIERSKSAMTVHKCTIRFGDIKRQQLLCPKLRPAVRCKFVILDGDRDSPYFYNIDN